MSPALPLTPEQELAIGRRAGPLAVSAAAGSGKTAVLVERFVRAVVEDGVEPGAIVAITFTERAAGELAERLRTRFLALGRSGSAREVERALVGTFHGFCMRLLRAHPLAAGVGGRLAVLDAGVAARLRASAFASALRELVREEGDGAVALAGAYGLARLERMVLGIYDELRSRGEDRPRLPSPPPGGIAPAAAATGDAPALAACRLMDGLLTRFGERYEQGKEQRGALDFDDIELRAGSLLDRDPSVRERWRERIALIMVDELQDVNPRQLSIVRALERENLFTVGDELQSIYGFRHADVGLFRARHEELGARGAALALTHNFRSRPEIVAAVNRIFGERFGERFSPLQPGRDDRPARVPPIELLLSDAAFRDDERMSASAGELLGARRELRAEARLLAQRLSELLSEGEARPRDVAVLVRRAGPLGAIAQALEELGIPVLAGGGRLWRSQEACDLLAYARAVANPEDEVALYGALASPLVGLSADSLALLATAGCAPERETASRRSAWEALADGWPPAGTLEPEQQVRLDAFRERFAGERRAASWLGAAGLLARVVADSGYERWLEGRPAAERRVESVRRLVRHARRFEREEGGDLRAFLDHAAFLAAEEDRRGGPAPVAGEEAEAVRLMTIHAAKGLEFPVVAVGDLGSRPNLGLPDLLVGGERVGLRLASLGSPETEPALAYEELAAQRRAAQEAEEDRILYVALTRARERLLLSGVVRFDRWPEATGGCAPLAWLGPALVPDLAARVLAARTDGAPTHAPSAPAPTLVLEGSGGRVRALLSTPANLGAVLRSGWLVQGPPPAQQNGGVPAGMPFRAGTAAASGRDRRGGGAPAEGARAGGGDGAPPRLLASDARPVPALEGGEISYSALGALERCGYRYYVERVLRLPEPPARAAREGARAAASLTARERGVLLHALLEGFDFAGEQAAGAEIARLARDRGFVPGRGEAEALAALLEAARESPFGRRMAGLLCMREQRFAFPLGAAKRAAAARGEGGGAGQGRVAADRIVTGTLDAIAFTEGGEALVVDYKSDHLDGDEDLGAIVERDYGTQRLIYALAALHAGAASVEVVHWFLERPDEPVGAVVLAAQREQLEEALRERLARALERGYAVSESPDRMRCAGCPARGTLCSWSEAATRAAPGERPASPARAAVVVSEAEGTLAETPAGA
jgi:ATP-dependent helicase/nuclease subunit A